MIIKLFEEYTINHSDKRNGNENFYFNTKKHEYKISFSKKDEFYFVGFKAKLKESSDYEYDHTILTNENPYEVINTVSKVCVEFYNNKVKEILDFAKLYNNDIEPNDYIKGFCFSFQGDAKKNKQRLLLYKRCFENLNLETKLFLKDNIYYLEII